MYKNRTAYSLAAILLFIIVITGVSHHGRNSRRFAQNMASVTIETPEKAYDVWKEKKVKGRILLLFDNFPHMVGLNKYDGIPRLSQWNLFEISIFENIIRKIFLIVPDQDWEKFQQNYSIVPISKVGNLDREISIDTQSGVPIIATTLSSLPHLAEEPLVYINDQKFDNEKIMDFLSRKKIVSDVIIRYHAR
jgi:hypothetical protein